MFDLFSFKHTYISTCAINMILYQRKKKIRFESDFIFLLIKFYIYLDERGILLTNNCPGPSHDAPKMDTLTCNHEFQISEKMTFKHNDT